MLHEHHLTVERTARYFTIEPAEGGARDVWIACHGYSQLAEKFLRPFDALDDGTRLFVAPEALSRFYLHPEPPPTGQGRIGASWMTREERESEIADYVAYLDALARHLFRRVDRAQAALRAFGFSQGAATAARWAAQGTTRVDQVILWGGHLPPDLDLSNTARFGARPLLMVWGEDDQWFDAGRLHADEARLEAAGVAHETILFKGGHRLSREVLRRIAAER